MDRFDQMPAGRELDRLVAALLGDREEREGEGCSWWHSTDGSRFSHEDGGPQHYSTCWDATGRLLAWMREHGSSVALDWGEDNALWECAWITGGNRLLSCSTSPQAAVCRAAVKVTEKR